MYYFPIHIIIILEYDNENNKIRYIITIVLEILFYVLGLNLI